MLNKITCIIMLLISCSVSGQLNRYASFELAGAGGIASFNYEKCFFAEATKSCTDPYQERPGYWKCYWRVGFSLAPVDKNNGTAIVLPVLVHVTFGPKSHALDVGLGQTFSVTTKGRPFIMMPASLGYRFQPTEKNYFLRFAYTPIISYLVDFQWQNWAGITFGYKLNR